MSQRIRPVMFVWSGEAMVPNPRFMALCKRQFSIDGYYALAPVDNVGNASRGGFFASIRETWKNLPEDDDRFPSPEHLRKRALIGGGWALHTQTVLDTPNDAKKFAIGLRRHDEYAVITVRSNVVNVYVAKSIAHGQITADEWRVVKPQALDWVAAQINVRRTELERHSKDGGAR